MKRSRFIEEQIAGILWHWETTTKTSMLGWLEPQSRAALYSRA